MIFTLIDSSVSPSIRSPAVDDKARQKLEETTRWEPGEVEGRIFDEWMEGGYFHPEATGSAEDLAYVSPRTGRAVSRAAAGPYKEKLLPLPGFLSTGGVPSDQEALRQGLDLTGFFLERHVFWPHNKPLPPARARFMESLQR